MEEPQTTKESSVAVETITSVVLDGSNILHGGSLNHDEKMDPQRLLSAIRHYQQKGYDVTTVIRMGSYNKLRYGNDGYLPGHALGLCKDPTVVKADADDLLLIRHGLETSSFIVSQDKFLDWRKRFPEIDWMTVEKLQRGVERKGDNLLSSRHWRFEKDGTFVDDGIPSLRQLVPEELLALKIKAVEMKLQECLGFIAEHDSLIPEKWVEKLNKYAGIFGKMRVQLEERE